MNLKSLQYIMRHSNINITLNLYTHAFIDGGNKKFDDIKFATIYTAFDNENMREI